MVHQQKVSIIIPFYNEEKLLERAITSAVQQTYDLIEIILVNDGSTDTSLEIARAHYKLDPRVKVFSSVNLGLGNARNIGLEKATGDFIIFLDSDDALSAMAVEVLLKLVNNQQIDIGICMFAMHDKQGRPFKNAGWRLDNTAVSGTDAIKEMYSGGIASVVWAKIYRSTLVNKIKFPVGVWFEDRPFLMKSFLLTDKISFTDKILCNIYSREDSITRRVVTKKRIIDLYLIYEIEITILKENKALPELYQTIIHHHIIVLLDTFFLLAIDRDKIDNFEECKHIFWLYMEKFDRHRRQYAHTLNLKMKIALGLLRGVKLLPWNWAEAILKIVFRKKYKGIQLLKNS